MTLHDQTLVVLGGSAGIGLATARAAAGAGAAVVLTGRDPDRLEQAAKEVGAAGHAAFDAGDTDRLRDFFHGRPGPVDHVLVTAGGPYYAPLRGMDTDAATRHLAGHVRLTLEVAQLAATAVRPGGSLIFLAGTGGRRPASG
jgi:NADP-dependent 3-hydroxy acid dehydrogenase YdfG